MPLSPEAQKKREGKFTASFAPNLMAGDADEIFDKYLELIGDPDWKPKDLSEDWPPSWGSYGEPFILDWHQRKTKQEITRRGEFVSHPHDPRVGCTLDGYRPFDDSVIDSKVCSAWIPVDEILAYYTPQLIVQRACVNCQRASLLLVHGSAEPHEFEITIDPDYEAKVWERVSQFWYCVDNFIQPVEMTFPKLVPPEQWQTVDLDADGAQFNWAEDMKGYLGIWDRHKHSAELYDAAAKDIKKLLPDDIGVLVCAGIIVKRNRANAISIKRAGA